MIRYVRYVFLYHDIRTTILALHHPTCVALPYFMHFLDVIQCTAFILKEIDQVMWQKQTWIPLKASLWRCTQNWVTYHWQIYEWIYLNLSRTTTCGRHHQAGQLWNNPLEELLIKLDEFGKSQLVISFSLILKTGDGYLKEICISHDGYRKSIL